MIEESNCVSTCILKTINKCTTTKNQSFGSMQVARRARPAQPQQKQLRYFGLHCHLGSLWCCLVDMKEKKKERRKEEEKEEKGISKFQKFKYIYDI